MPIYLCWRNTKVIRTQPPISKNFERTNAGSSTLWPTKKYLKSKHPISYIHNVNCKLRGTSAEPSQLKVPTMTIVIYPYIWPELVHLSNDYCMTTAACKSWHEFNLWQLLWQHFKQNATATATSTPQTRAYFKQC